jgi:hypothetical protein
MAVTFPLQKVAIEPHLTFAPSVASINISCRWTGVLKLKPSSMVDWHASLSSRWWRTRRCRPVGTGRDVWSSRPLLHRPRTRPRWPHASAAPPWGFTPIACARSFFVTVP